MQQLTERDINGRHGEGLNPPALCQLELHGRSGGIVQEEVIYFENVLSLEVVLWLQSLPHWRSLRVVLEEIEREERRGQRREKVRVQLSPHDVDFKDIFMGFQTRGASKHWFH